MRTLPLLALLALAAAAPAPAQGIAVPVRCHGDCPPPGRLPRALVLDSIQVSANLANGGAATYVNHVFRNGTAGSVDAAFFFPLPDDAALTTVSVYEGRELKVYDDWSRPEESRWILEGIARERPGSGLEAYAGRRLVHVHLPAVPAGGEQRVQVGYTQPLRADGAAALRYRYPLSVAASAAPFRVADVVLVVRTGAGFRDLRSPSHAVDVQWGSEPAPCPPQARCGTRGVPSQRVRVVRLGGGRELRARDFELVYTPLPGNAPPGDPSGPAGVSGPP